MPVLPSGDGVGGGCEGRAGRGATAAAAAAATRGDGCHDDDVWVPVVALMEAVLAEARRARIVRRVWQWAAEAFKGVDTDADGFVSVEEFTKALTGVQPVRHPRELRQVFQRLTAGTGMRVRLHPGVA